MGRPRTLPPMSELEELLRAGHSHREIATIVSQQTGTPVARSTISAAFHRAGISGDAPRYLEELPWRVKTEHLHAYPARMLRLLGRRRAGLELSVEEDGRLTRWIDQLAADGDVVGYDPETLEGFWYVPARPQDGAGGIPVRVGFCSVQEIRRTELADPYPR